MQYCCIWNETLHGKNTSRSIGHECLPVMCPALLDFTYCVSIRLVFRTQLDERSMGRGNFHHLRHWICCYLPGEYPQTAQSHQKDTLHHVDWLYSDCYKPFFWRNCSPGANSYWWLDHSRSSLYELEVAPIMSDLRALIA